MRMRSRSARSIKMFTHGDLDGVGAAILAKVAYGDRVDIETIAGADKSSEHITEWINKKYDPIKYKALILTDLSVNDETADLIEQSGFEFKVLLDHHHTADGLNSRDWCLVKDTEDDCGTTLMYDFLFEFIEDPDILSTLLTYHDFVHQVHLYDNWLWKKEGTDVPNQLNTLLYILGKNRFIDRFIEDPKVEFSESEQALLLLDRERLDRYLYTIAFNSQVIEIELPGFGKHKVAVVHGTGDVNSISQELFKLYPVNIAMVINYPVCISLRLRDGSEEVNIGELAKALGGGGHTGSGGAPIDSDDIFNTTKLLLESKGATITKGD